MKMKSSKMQNPHKAQLKGISAFRQSQMRIRTKRLNRIKHAFHIQQN